MILIDTFAGTLDVWQNGKQHKDGLISTRNETSLIANVHDPSNYLKTADNLTYSWYNKTHFVANTSTEVLKVNFTEEGQYYYNVTLYALFNSTGVNSTGVIKNGFFETNVTVKGNGR